MMGKHLPQKNLFSFSVDLDERVRANHPLRTVAQKVDFSFVRQEVKDCYGYNGHVGLDPEIILKLMFLLFWDNIRSERELMRMLPERLDYLWFLGYTLDDAVPHHSVLSKARARWGEEVFETLFVRSVTEGRAGGWLETSHGWQFGGCQCLEGLGSEILTATDRSVAASLRGAGGEAGRPLGQPQL